MATPSEKLSESLAVLKLLQDKGFSAIHTSEISRVHRDRLIKNGFLNEVIKGWYIVISPLEHHGDSTSWFTSYWHFCARYLHERFGESYCLSADQSLFIHAGNWTVPNQLIIRTIDGTNSLTQLPHRTSMFCMKSPLPNNAEITRMNEILILTLTSAIIHCSPSAYLKNPIDVRTALLLIRDASEVLGLLLDGGHGTIAGRLAGAFRNIGQTKIADEIIKTMRSAGYDIREIDPFETPTLITLSSRERSPYVNKIRLMWHSMRESIIDCFPKSPGLPKSKKKYMAQIDELYVTDAYHSLSIEQYKVSPELIDRVRTGKWDITKNEDDRKHRDALAARGYWQATQKVRESISKILDKQNPGVVIENEHNDWYRELFGPSVVAGILKPSDLAGYRNNQVYIGQSKHLPLSVEAVRDTMPILFELLQNEKEASVRAVLGHLVFVYIHPYSDGNGRMARFLMNTMLASGGYPWTVIPVNERKKYMDSLETASVEQNIVPFAKFISYLVNEGMRGRPVAQL